MLADPRMKKRLVPRRRVRRARPLLVAAGALLLVSGCDTDQGVPAFQPDLRRAEPDLSPEPIPPDMGLIVRD